MLTLPFDDRRLAGRDPSYSPQAELLAWVVQDCVSSSVSSFGSPARSSVPDSNSMIRAGRTAVMSSRSWPVSDENECFVSTTADRQPIV